MTDSEDRREPELAIMRTAIDEIVKERHYQSCRWGTVHDVAHSMQDWVSILTVWLGKAASQAPPYTEATDKQNRDAFRKRLVQLAAISVAAIEALDQQ